MLNIEKIKPELINSGFLLNVIYFEELGSTNEYLSSPEIPVDTLVISDYQLTGKGRGSAKWESEKYKNLTFSIKKDFSKFDLQNSSVLNYFSFCIFNIIKKIPFAAGSDIIEDNFWIKWPNDIYYKNKKVCGILSETKFGSGIFIIGIGLNCNQVFFPENLNAVSLKLISGIEIDLNDLLLQLILSFSVNMNYLLPSYKHELFKKWKEAAKMQGKRCEFVAPDGIVNSGIIKDLNLDGSISIIVNDEIKKFYSGELKLTSFNVF